MHTWKLLMPSLGTYQGISVMPLTHEISSRHTAGPRRVSDNLLMVRGQGKPGLCSWGRTSSWTQ